MPVTESSEVASAMSSGMASVTSAMEWSATGSDMSLVVSSEMDIRVHGPSF